MQLAWIHETQTLNSTIKTGPTVTWGFSVQKVAIVIEWANNLEKENTQVFLVFINKDVGSFR